MEELGVLTEFPPSLSTERLELRGWVEADRLALAAIKLDPLNWRFIASGPPETPEVAAGQVDELRAEWRRWGVGSWAVMEVSTGELLGDCGVKLTDRGPQLAYMMSREHWGRGFATEASRAVLDYVFDAHDWPAVYASTDAANVASQRVLEKIGMKKQDTGASQRHEYWYAVRRDDYGSEPAPPSVSP